jgi:hypothetical protein
MSFAQKLLQHLFAFLLIVLIVSWPGFLAFQPRQNWYVPLAQPCGVADGGLFICIMVEMTIVFVILATIVLETIRLQREAH